jgi:hypothetical protein
VILLDDCETFSIHLEQGATTVYWMVAFIYLAEDRNGNIRGYSMVLHITKKERGRAP